MKGFHRLLIFVLLFYLSIKGFAQDYGVKAGVNISNMLVRESSFFSYKDNFQNNTGFHIGPTVEFHLLDFLSVEGGLLFNTKGYTGLSDETVNNETHKISEKKNLFFLDLPLTVKVPFSIGNQHLYGSAGGYASMGLMGDSKISSYYGTRINKLKWGAEGESDDLKRYDYGLTFGTGINLDPFQIGISYSMGLANLSPENTPGAELSNRVLGISVSYLFGRTTETVQEIKSGEERKSIQPRQPRTSKRKKAEMEAEKLRLDKIRADSIAAANAEQERLRIAKARADSIEAARAQEAARAEARRLEREKIRADSIAAVQKNLSLQAAKNTPVYRVQFASSSTKKGSYSINVGGKTYKTWEYFYSGAYRSTAGEFKTFREALAFQNSMRKSGYTQAFVAAFINGKRSTDPALFR